MYPNTLQRGGARHADTHTHTRTRTRTHTHRHTHTQTMVLFDLAFQPWLVLCSHRNPLTEQHRLDDGSSNIVFQHHSIDFPNAISMLSLCSTHFADFVSSKSNVRSKICGIKRRAGRPRGIHFEAKHSEQSNTTDTYTKHTQTDTHALAHTRTHTHTCTHTHRGPGRPPRLHELHGLPRLRAGLSQITEQPSSPHHKS